MNALGLSPWADALLTGGISILVVGLAFSWSPGAVGLIALAQFSALSFLLNWPHFIGAYQLLYATPRAFEKYRVATLYLPAVLVLYAVVSVAFYARDPLPANILITVSALYLAWHYTGQTWGMIASFAYVEGLRFDSVARTLIRTNLRILLGWHVAWCLQLDARAGDVQAYFPIYEAASGIALVSSVLGLIGLYRLRRQCGRLAARVVIPWVAIHLWYALLYRFGAPALVWVQLFHATQYLVFPLRVERNRAARTAVAGLPGWHTARHYLFLAAVGLVGFWVVPHLAQGAWVRWADSFNPIDRVIIAALNVHHYFVDGCIWKLQNPEVRRDLFAHLAGEAKT